MQTQKPVLEYMGELLPDGHLSLPPDIFGQIKPGQKLKIRIEPCTLKSDGIPDDWADPVEIVCNETVRTALSAEEFLQYARSMAKTGGYCQETITREFIHDRDI